MRITSLHQKPFQHNSHLGGSETLPYKQTEFRLKTAFLLSFIVVALFLYPALTVAQECVGRPECYELPPIEPPGLPGEPAPSNTVVNAAWEGFSDGRLNPELIEYYSAWCMYDTIRVLRGVPETALVDNILMVDVMRLGDNASFVSDNGVSVSRSGDTVQLAGTNGNLSPEFGTKTFSLAECIQRNGREPFLPSEEVEENPPSDDEDEERCVRTEFESCDLNLEQFQQFLMTWVVSLCTGPIGLVFAFNWRRPKKRYWDFE
jgi:hypothetical protein